MTKRCIVAVCALVGLLASTAHADGGKMGKDHASSPSPRSSTSGSSDSGSSTRRSQSSVSLGQASQEEASEAIAHYARSRNLLIAALNEFDKARKIANPSELLDAPKWRNTLIDRAEDLDRVLDPQPRATKGGIKFQADPRLLPEAHK
jgi:hypothetical protein